MHAVLLPVAVILLAPLMLFAAPWFAFDMLRKRGDTIQEKAIAVGFAAAMFGLALLIFVLNPSGAYD